MRKFVYKLAGYSLPAFLVLIGSYLAWKNYVPGSYTIGWDSLHPEFNFSQNLGKMVSGVWREDQGVGTVAAHAHMADLPRVAFLWLFSRALPASMLRYFFISLCLVLGPLGIYFFLRYVFQKERPGIVGLLASFLGSLFYLLNLATLQQFIVPFEMFLVAYAGLPWIFYFAVKYLDEGRRKNLLIFTLVVLLSAPMAYASAQFYAFLACFAVFLVGCALLHKFKTLKKGIVLIALVLLVNSFWLLPNIYSVVKQGEVIQNSKINLLFSPEAFLRNQDYGGELKDLAFGKNFLFSWLAYDFNGKNFIQLTEVWNNHLESRFSEFLGYSFAAIFSLGFLVSLAKKNKVGLALILPAAISLFFLININPPTGGFYTFLYRNIGLFREGFRMPYTKFSIPLLVATSFYFGYFFLVLFSVLSARRTLKMAIAAIFPLVIAGLVAFMLPAFRGNLVSQAVQTQLPDYYKEMFGWFEGKEGRIARLPLNTIWGWDYQGWGYQGSGFLGFGLAGPLLVRDYDRWSPGNESFYNQASFALYNNDPEAFEDTLKKYQVKYLLLDESIVNAGGTNNILYIPQIKDFMTTSSHIKESAKFGFLTIYETDFDFGSGFISPPETYTSLDVNLDYSEKDPVYSLFGDYVQDKKAVSYPFVNFDARAGTSIVREGQNIVFENHNLNLKVPVPIAAETVESFGADRGFETATNCDLKKNGQVEKQRLEEGNLYKAADGGVSCDYFYYPNLVYNQGYVLRVKGRNLSGRGLKIYLQNIKTGRMDLEDLLSGGSFDSYYLILPKDLAGAGYTLNVETRSFGRIPSENEVDLIEFIPVSVDSLYELKSANANPRVVTNKLKIKDVKKVGTWFYDVKTAGGGLLELGQGYDDGWVAISKYKLLDHTKVNSWANGWFTNGNGDVLIVFWPQLLEYFGFVLLGIALVVVIRRKKS